MEIEAIEIRLLPGHKTTRVFCDVRIGDIRIYDFRVIQDNGKPYVKAPFVTYKNRNGELCFRQIVDLPAEVRGRIDNVILSAF